MGLEFHRLPEWRVYFRNQEGKPVTVSVEAVAVVYSRGRFEWRNEAGVPMFVVTADQLDDMSLANAPGLRGRSARANGR